MHTCIHTYIHTWNQTGRVEPSCGLIPNGTCFAIKLSMVLPRGATSDKFQVFSSVLSPVLSECHLCAYVLCARILCACAPLTSCRMCFQVLLCRVSVRACVCMQCLCVRCVLGKCLLVAIDRQIVSIINGCTFSSRFYACIHTQTRTNSHGCTCMHTCMHRCGVVLKRGSTLMTQKSKRTSTGQIPRSNQSCKLHSATTLADAYTHR